MEEWINEKALVLSSEFKHYKSLDSFLVKLSSLAYDVEDYAFGDQLKAKTIFEEILKHRLLSEYISILSCHRDEIEARIARDPRIRKLRDYSDVLFKVLSSTPCRESRTIDTSTREATFRIEQEEERVVARKPIEKIAGLKTHRIFLWIGVALVVLAIIYALIILLR